MQRALLFTILVILSIQAKSQVFYVCKSPDGDTTFYLLGTHHYLPKKVKLDTSLLGAYLRDSDVVFSELFVDDGGSRYKAVLANLEKSRRYPLNGLLKDSISKDEFQRIFLYYNRLFGVSKKSFERVSYYRPWMMDSRLRYDRNEYYPMDDLLYKLAGASGKTIRNLDNENLLNAASASLNSSFDVRWLLSRVSNGDNIKTDDEIIARAYLEQDTATMLKHMYKDPEHQKHLIDDRNKHWLEVFEQFGGRTNFVYCGMAHLIAGQYALLTYFQSKHYTVKAIDIRLFNAVGY